MGYNYALSPLSAAYGISQLQVWDQKVACRRQLFSQYQEFLKGDSFSWQTEGKGVFSSRWLATVVAGDKKSEEIEQLIDNQIFEVRRVWKPMFQQPVFSHFKSFLNGTSEELFKNGICLPTGEPKMSLKEIEEACALLV